MLSIYRYLGLCFILFAGRAVADECQHLRVNSAMEYPPYMWQVDENTEALGAVIDFMTYISQLTQIKLEPIFVGNMARVHEEIKANNLDMMAGVFYNDERAQLIDFLQPPIAYSNTRIWVHADTPANITVLSQLDALQGASVLGFSLGNTFDHYAQEHLRINRLRSAQQAFRMLVEKRVDYVVFEEEPGFTTINSMGIKNLVMLPLLVASEGIYMGVAKHSTCNTPLLKQRLEQALRQAQTEKVIDQFVVAAQQQFKAVGQK